MSHVWKPLVLVALFSIGSIGEASVAMPSVFGDNMVLQRDRPIRLWGWATPGERITVVLGSQTKVFTTPQTGTFRVALDPMPAGGPYTLLVSGENQLKFDNVLMGDVFVCSGQSNMQWSVASSNNAQQEIAAANHPTVRLHQANLLSTEHPLADNGGRWTVCAPETIAGFSAVAYFFGRELSQRLGVPIGLIHTSWGGTPAESWTPRSSLRTIPTLAERLEAHVRAVREQPTPEEYDASVLRWAREAIPGFVSTPEEIKQFASPDASENGWTSTVAPAPTGQGWFDDVNGIAWLRHTFAVPMARIGERATLHLSPIDDFDETYVNGRKVGERGLLQGTGWDQPRVYEIPAGLLRLGNNVIAIRVLDTVQQGGLRGEPSGSYIEFEGGDRVPLGGQWYVKNHRVRPEGEGNLLDSMPARPAGAGNSWAPGGLYNAMIAPFTGFTVRGAIWYQGESNAGEPELYAQLFPMMIESWRKAWGQPELPFFFVQLANWQPGGNWGWIREAQTAALRLPKTGMATAIDIGDSQDIHPRNKQDVGLRLALSALAVEYGQNVPHTGPRYGSFEVQGSAIQVRFGGVSGSLQLKPGEPSGFEIAGEDRVFVPARAELNGPNMVRISSPAVTKPVAVRYLWAGDPRATVYDDSGLPAVPFRTDNWPRQ